MKPWTSTLCDTVWKLFSSWTALFKLFLSSDGEKCLHFAWRPVLSCAPTLRNNTKQKNMLTKQPVCTCRQQHKVLADELFEHSGFVESDSRYYQSADSSVVAPPCGIRTSCACTSIEEHRVWSRLSMDLLVLSTTSVSGINREQASVSLQELAMLWLQ